MPTSLPNILTVSRILAIPPFVAAFYLPSPAAEWATFALFVAASLTDWLDGWLARRWRQTSELGALLDPIADKLLVAAALVMLAGAGRAPVLAVLVILARELMVSGLREYMATRSLSLPVTQLAKWKTATQMAALCLLLVGDAAGVEVAGVSVPAAGAALLWLAAVLTVATGWHYLRATLAHAGGRP